MRRTCRGAILAGFLAVLAAGAARAAPDEIEGIFEVRLALHEAVFHGDEQTEGAPALLVDMVRSGDRWERAWATAGDYSKDEHAGRVVAAEIGEDRMAFDLSIELHGDGFASGGRVKVRATLEKGPEGRFVGTYEGISRGIPVEGRAEGEIKPPRRHRKPGYAPVRPGEHPRLLFRRSDLAALKAKAKTPFGKLALAKMDTNAAGFAFRYALTGDADLAEEARRRVEALMKDEDNGDKRVRSRWWAWRVEQAALAYDLCYDTWPEDFKKEVAEYLLRVANNLFYNRGRFDSHINWNYAASHGPTMLWASGMAGLVLWGEKGPAPEKPVAPYVLGEEGGRIEPPVGYTPGKGVEIAAPKSGQMPRDWLYVGPFPDDGRDHLAKTGGMAGARPSAGAEVASAGSTAAWRKLSDEEAFYRHEKYTGGRSILELTGPSGVAVHTMSYYFTALRNTKPRWVRVDLGHGRVEAFLGGVRLLDGGVAYLEEGVYPWLLTGPIGDLKPWGKTFMEPRLTEISASDAAEATAAARSAYEKAVADWAQDHAQWERTGGCDVRYLKAYETSRHIMTLILRNMLGTGGFMSGDGQMAGMDGPNKYLFAHRNVFCHDPSPYGEGADYLPRVMFCFPYRPDGQVIGQEINGTPGFGCSGYPESGRDTACENFATLSPLVREAWKPAVLWAWQYHTGGSAASEEAMQKILTAPRRGYAFSRDYGGFNTHPLYAFINYPLDAEPKPPEGIMPRTWQAPDFGFYGFRNAWTGSDEQFITQFFAATYGEGAGTLRIAGLGQVWSHGLGKPTENRYGESVVQMPENDINAAARARVTFLDTRPDGSGALSLDMDDVYTAPVFDARGRRARLYGRYGRVRRPHCFVPSGIRGMRALAVDYSGLSGAPCMVVMVDQIRGGKTKSWTWQLESKSEGAGKSEKDPKRPGWITFRGRSFNNPRNGQLLFTESKAIEDDDRVTLHDDGFTFTRGDALLRATFVAPARPRLELAEKAQYRDMPKGGVRRDSSRAIFAEGGDEFLVILTIQRGDPPAVKVSGTGLDAKVTVGRRVVTFDGEKIVLGR